VLYTTPKLKDVLKGSYFSTKPQKDDTVLEFGSLRNNSSEGHYIISRKDHQPEDLIGKAVLGSTDPVTVDKLNAGENYDNYCSFKAYN
jgi:hypothetical protein